MLNPHTKAETTGLLEENKENTFVTRAGKDFLDMTQRRNRQKWTDTLKTSTSEGAIKTTISRTTRNTVSHGALTTTVCQECSQLSKEKTNNSISKNSTYWSPIKETRAPQRCDGFADLEHGKFKTTLGAPMVLESEDTLGKAGARQRGRAHTERAPTGQHRNSMSEETAVVSYGSRNEVNTL